MLDNKKAVLFDLDGVLVSMPDGHYQALNKALKLFGHEIGPDDHIKIYNGLPTAEKLKMMTEKGKLPLALHPIIKKMKKIYTEDEIKKRCKPDYSKILLLSALKAKGIKIACCSNAIQVSVEEMLERAMLKGYFDEIIGNDVGFAPKPAPDIYLEAMKRLDVKPEECIIVEDAEHGYQAAVASGAGDVFKVTCVEDVNLNLFKL